MKAASLQEIKQELKERTPAQVVELCLRLGRFKKENKELLTYLLFEAADQQQYIRSVKEEMETGFDAINRSSLYIAKKSLRKILRITNKYIRYTGDKVVETELLLHYCALLQNSRIAYHKSTALVKLRQGQLKKIESAIGALHEDLQYDYRRQLEALEE
jgi:hypothetical protein